MDNKSGQEKDDPAVRGKFVCGECGSERIKTSREIYNFPYGVGAETVELSCEVPIRNCAVCGFSFIDGEAEDICHEEVCKHIGVMPPSQIKALRELYELTQAQFSEITKLGEATLSRWERGIVIQNQAYDNYLYLLGYEENLQKIRERGESPEPMEPAVKRVERPQFRELDVNDEVLQKQDSFKLYAWESARAS